MNTFRMTFRRPGLLVASFSLICIASLALAACGDDDSSGGGGGGGTDASYMAAVCKASVKAKNAADKLDLSSASALKTYGDAVDQFAKDIQAANPPSDVKAYNDTIVKYFHDLASKLRGAKDISALADAGAPPTPPSQAIQDRLQKIADANADCKASNFNFNE